MTRPNGWHRRRKPAPRRTTTERGYGATHAAEAKRRRQTLTPADPCGYCGKPLGPERLPGDRASRWELPHTPDRTGYLPGMWHARCNRTEGGRRGSHTAHQRRRTTRLTW